MQKFLFNLIIIVGFLAASQKASLEAWNETGHMLVAEIAKDQLEPPVREEVERLINYLSPFYPETSTLITAATWADHLRAHGMGAFNQWHYITLPYDPEQFLTSEDHIRIASEQKGNNVQWALEQCISTLKNPKSGDFEKALMLRFLLHFVADIHQPMHCTTLYSQKFPEGDRGGNLYKINVPEKNLHQYWDNGAGFLKLTDETGETDIQHLAKEATDTYPLASAENNLEPKISSWAEESHDLAISVSYQIPEESQPTEDYINKAQETAKTRVALAGYRLAHLLNSIFSALHK